MQDFRKLKWRTSDDVCRSDLYLCLLLHSNVIKRAIFFSFLNKSIIY